MILTARFTNQGGREKNEDSHDIFVKNDSVCAVVADGVGGHGGGELASANAIETLKCLYNNTESQMPIEFIKNWYQIINDKVCEMQTESCKMMTTLCTLFTDNNSCFYAHVGDSRIYYFKDEKLFARTLDHSVAQLAVMNGEITEDQIRQYPDRNKILRSIGKNAPVNVDVSDMFDVSQGKNAFLICSDGFWEYIYEEEMEALLSQSTNPIEWKDKMVELVNSRVPEDCDNYTAVVVWINN